MGLDSEEPRRSFGIKVHNLPVRSTGKLEKFYKACARELSILFLPFVRFLIITYFEDVANANVFLYL